MRDLGMPAFCITLVGSLAGPMDGNDPKSCLSGRMRSNRRTMTLRVFWQGFIGEAHGILRMLSK
jgi:hypothetical protein